MTELQLYKWINYNNIECHYNHDFTELWVLPNTRDMDEFFKIIPRSMLDDGGIDCKICQGYFAIELISIAENCDIEIENILSKTEENQ